VNSNLAAVRRSRGLSHQFPNFIATTLLAVLSLGLAGCRHTDPGTCKQPSATAALTATNQTATTASPATNKPAAKARRYTYTPRVYPVDERGFSPVDKALAKAYAREDMVKDDDEGSLNPYVLKIISAYPLDGSYAYHCGWTPREYDIYNGVTQDLWYKGMVVAKAYPDGSRCSYCCGFTFEAFVRAMKLRNVQKGLDQDDFNGMTFYDLFNLLQLWYIEGPGDCERRGITAYGLGHAVTNLEDARPGDFLSYSTTPSARRPEQDRRHEVLLVQPRRHARRGLRLGPVQRLERQWTGASAQVAAHRPRGSRQRLQAV
jgi:hypothetical protein